MTLPRQLMILRSVWTLFHADQQRFNKDTTEEIEGKETEGHLQEHT